MIAKFLNFSFSLWPCPLLPTLNLHFNSNEKPMKLFCKVKETKKQKKKNFFAEIVFNMFEVELLLSIEIPNLKPKFKILLDNVTKLYKLAFMPVCVIHIIY
jgi:hypothetical protein